MDVVLMKRIGIYFCLKDGAREEYIKAHKTIWPAMRAVLDEAGIQNYSIWNLEEKLFAYYEVEDEIRMQEILNSSPVYLKWRSLMERFIFKEPNTGQKEWGLEMVFFNQGKEKE